MNKYFNAVYGEQKKSQPKSAFGSKFLLVLLVILIGITNLQAQNCPSPAATDVPITSGNYSVTTALNSVRYVNGSVRLGDATYAHTLTISVTSTVVVSAGSHLSVNHLNVDGTLIIQDGATVSLGTIVGGGSLSVATVGAIKMCSNSGIEVCGVTTLAAIPSLQYFGTASASAVAKFANYPGYGGSLTMPWGAGAANSSRIWIVYGPPAGGLFNIVGLPGLASTCTVGSCPPSLPFPVQTVNCGGFFINCNAGNTAPALSATSLSNVCPFTTANLSTISVSNTPANTVFEWHSGSPVTAANNLTSFTAVSAGTYYAVFHDIVNNCYSPATAVTVSVNYCPTFNPDFGVTNINVPLTGNVNTNDNPTPGSTYGNPPANPSNPSICAPVVAADGSYTFVCATPGVYTFYVPVCEPSPSTVCTPVPLQITVNDPARNDNAPVANPDYATTKAGTPVTVDLRANDKCQNGPACTLSTPTLVTAPLHGTFDPATGVYTPAAGFVGKDSLQYNVCDNQAVPKCTSTWAYFDVKPAGSANITNAADDYKQTAFGVSATGNVKTNDTDPEGDVQTVAPQTTTVAGKGTLTLLADGSYTFAPVAGFSGPVDFIYTTCDNGTPSACDTATLHVLVTPKEPVFNPDFGVTNINVPLTGNVSTNDNQTPGSTYGNPPANPSNPSSCAPVVAADGSYTFVCATPGVYTFYVPVCEPSPSTVCTPVLLQITVNDPARNDNAPVANPDYATTKAGTPVTVDLRANDKCQNGPACTLSTPTVVTAPLHGTFDPATGVYTPAAGFVGKDSLQYNVCDNQAVPKCTSTWAYFDVKPAGSANITNAADDYKQTAFGVSATGNVKTNDTDPEGDAQTVAPQTTTVAGKGTLTLLADGSYTFVPVAGFSGPVDFIYTTCDNGTPSACDTATLHVLVTPKEPTFNPDFGVTNINVPLTGNVSTNDNQTPGSTYGNPPANPSNPSSCAPVVAADGSYTFVCATPGVYTFYVPVCEPSPSTVCTPVLLQITVNDPARNDNAPVANPDYATTKSGTPVTVDLRANDRCQNGPACTLSTPTVVTAPLHGTFDPATGVYTPAAGFVGKDSLQYNVCDNQAVPKCTSTWAYFDVKPAGSANITNAADDYKQTPFGVSATGNVKTNDTDPEGNTQTVAPQTTTVAGKGTLTLLADGSYTFVPVAGFSGPVDFIYTTCDNGTPSACDTATLHVLVTPKEPAFNPDFGVTNINVPLTGNVNTNDNPTPGSTYSNPPANPSNPSSCAPVVAADGSYTFVCATPGVYTFYVPVCEPSPSTVCTPVLLQITVHDPARNDNAPVANPDYATTKAGTPVTVDLRANDKCQNGPACTLSTPTVVTAPQHGTFDPATGVYTPAAGFVGKDSLQYNVCDNQAVPKCTSTWAYFDVKPAGSANITNAADDYKQTAFGVSATGNVKTNDTDPEGDAQTVAPQTTTVAGKGTLTLLADGSYTFVPVAGFSGPVDFIYTTCDNGTPSACDTATLHVLVTPKEPTFNPDFGVTNINEPLTGNVSTNDTPTPGSTYSNPPANPSNPSSCAPVVAADGSYTFVCATPGVYTFYVPVCEPSPSTVCTPVLLQITVNDPSRNGNAPVANPDYATTKAGTPVTVDLRANDKCQNGPACTLSTPTVVTAPLHGTFDPATGVYTPAAGFVGKDSLQYNVCDNQAVPKCTSTWAYFDVKPAGSPNITNAADDYKQTAFGVSATGNVKTNDTDPEGDAQTVAPQTTTVAGKGTLTLLADGSYTFVPVTGFTGPVEFVYNTCDNGTPTACNTATLRVLVDPAFAAPDFTPTIDIDALSFATAGGARDFVLNVTEILNNPSSGQIVVRIFKASAFNITYDPSATSASVFGGTPVNNADWIITENAFSITCTSKPGVTLTGFNLSSIGFNISRKIGIPGNTSQNITATISNSSGADSNNLNNQYTVTITAQ